MSRGAAIRYGISMKLSFWLKRPLTEQDRVAAALETAAYMRWVETREKRSPADTAVDLYIKGILDRKHLKTTSDDLKMIAVLALSTNLDLVHAFITSTKFILITHYPQPPRCGTKQEHAAVSAGLNDGAQQGAISKGAQRGPVCCSLRNRGSVPGGGDALALAIRLCLPGLRRAASQLRQDPGALPVYRLSAADIRDRRNDFRSSQGAAVHLVSRGPEIAPWAQRNSHPASTVVSDGLHCFTGVGNAGCVHQPIITGSGRKAALNPAFKWVNTTLGNIKSAITGTYRTIRHKHVPRYLAEFEYRFNRRYDLAAMMPRLGYVAVRTPPMPYRLLKLAEDHA